MRSDKIVEFPNFLFDHLMFSLQKCHILTKMMCFPDASLTFSVIVLGNLIYGHAFSHHCSGDYLRAHFRCAAVDQLSTQHSTWMP